MPSNKIQLIIDTDPGQDDAAALMMAFGLENLKLIDFLAITTVAGNVPLALTQKNARIIADWVERQDIPIYPGAVAPLAKKLITAENVHGQNGLDGVPLHDPITPLQETHAAVFLSETLKAATPHSITLCPIGPLTNIALALSLDPTCKEGIKEMVIMGGTFFEPGNITPNADFNFFVDPIAAKIVLDSRVPLRIIPLDVTHKACLTQDRVKAIRSLGNKNGPRLADILQSYERFDTQKFGLDGGPLHDPCAVACAVFPEWFVQKHVHVDIDTHHGISEGATSVDWYGLTGLAANAYWASDLDSDAFYQCLTDAIATLP